MISSCREHIIENENQFLELTKVRNQYAKNGLLIMDLYYYYYYYYCVLLNIILQRGNSLYDRKTSQKMYFV